MKTTSTNVALGLLTALALAAIVHWRTEADTPWASVAFGAITTLVVAVMMWSVEAGRVGFSHATVPPLAFAVGCVVLLVAAFITVDPEGGPSWLAYGGAIVAAAVGLVVQAFLEQRGASTAG
ncbi:hypothetical protein ACMYYO_04485 [Dermacoccaceae bacterium W4C1]